MVSPLRRGAIARVRIIPGFDGVMRAGFPCRARESVLVGTVNTAISRPPWSGWVLELVDLSCKPSGQKPA